MADIRHAIRLCERHAEEWVPDPNEIVCLYCESLTCEGPLHKYVPASQLAGAVDLLRELSERWTDVRVSGNAARCVALGDAIRRAQELIEERP